MVGTRLVAHATPLPCCQSMSHSNSQVWPSPSPGPSCSCSCSPADAVPAHQCRRSGMLFELNKCQRHGGIMLESQPLAPFCLAPTMLSKLKILTL